MLVVPGLFLGYDILCLSRTHELIMHRSAWHLSMMTTAGVMKSMKNNAKVDTERPVDSCHMDFMNALKRFENVKSYQFCHDVSQVSQDDVFRNQSILHSVLRVYEYGFNTSLKVSWSLSTPLHRCPTNHPPTFPVPHNQTPKTLHTIKNSPERKSPQKPNHNQHQSL